ncbi:MAG: hypothetical protein K0R40_4115 [Burkholderiales bacterium]|jgi:hypothetical protein|nr:hypothetical protein [Burkholderiales bacterium]
MDKRKRWREEEERLVARWNAAALRYREVQAEISSQGTETEALKLKAQTAREEIEAVRREVARLKVEFNSGKRY